MNDTIEHDFLSIKRVGNVLKVGYSAYSCDSDFDTEIVLPDESKSHEKTYTAAEHHADKVALLDEVQQAILDSFENKDLSLLASLTVNKVIATLRETI